MSAAGRWPVMDKRLHATVSRLRQLRAKAHKLAERRAEFSFNHNRVLYELAELARRSLRRRRHGDR